MPDPRLRDCSCEAKIARVVLGNCGPLSPSEVAEEAFISTERAQTGLSELEERDVAKPVCGMCSKKEVVYALTNQEEPTSPNP